MSREYIEQGLPWSWTVERVLGAIADRSSNVVLVAARADVLGFGIMYYGDQRAHLALLAVQPAHRRQGWGGRLLRWLIEPARALDLARVQLEARADNPDAIAFYERHGFRRRGTLAGYYRGSIDAVRLERALRAGEAGPMVAPVRILRDQEIGEIGVYRLEGPMSLEQASAQGAAAIAMARAQQLQRLLILAAGLELPTPPAVLDRALIGERWAAAAGAIMRVAVVTGAITGAMGRGAVANVFDTETAARAWLAQRP
jgi:ribosomal-protein-alanine N-acetyltransferase